MSKRPSIVPIWRISIFLSLAFLAVASLTISERDRHPAASGKLSKEALLANNSRLALKFKHTEKLRGPLTTVVSSSSNPPEKAGDVFTLKAEVVSHKDLTYVEGHWIIPKGVEVINGATTVNINDLKAKEPIEIFITLKQVSDRNEQIHFKIRSVDQSRGFSATGQFNSLNQMSIDKSKFLLQQRAAEEMKNSKKTNLKVFQ